jgi:aminopeptidase N
VTGNLTRAEAADRARLLKLESYWIELDLHGSDTSFGSLTTVRFSCTRPGASSFIDLAATEVMRISLNGREMPTDLFDDHRVRLPELASLNELTIEARCPYSSNGDGLHRFTDPADDRVYLYTNLETAYAHQVWACFDQPDLKATFEFIVRCPAGWKVISTEDPDQAAEPTDTDGVVRWHFPPTPPMSTYVTAIAAGPYHVVRTEHDGIPLGLICRQSLAAYLDADEIFEFTRQGFDYFHAAFGRRYPFAKYDQIFVPEFNAGAMENAGAVTIHEDFIFRSRVTEARRESRAETLLHELAHMWFGDLVTMTWWDDLWLNESFATWASVVALAEATRWTNAWTTASQFLKAWAYRQDQLPSTHPIVADVVDIASVEVFFDGITYAKGAAVLKQLVAFVGRENFLTGLRAYFDRHAWGNATLADLLDALEQASGRQLQDWSKAWLETAGVNTLRPRYATAEDGTFTEFAVLQQAPDNHPVLRPHRIAIGLYDQADGTLYKQTQQVGSAGFSPQKALRRRQRIEVEVAGERTEVPALIGTARPDLVLVNDDDLTFAKIRLDEHSLRTAINSIGNFADQLPAALCLSAAWDMCRDAEMAARDYLALALAAVRTAEDPNVLQTVLGQATMAVRKYGDPAWRPIGLAQLATELRSLLMRAEPGSDRQLTFVNVFTAVAVSADDLSLLEGILSGEHVIPGLTVDTELRWHLLRRLVSRGSAGEAAIEAERERDRTDAGDRYAQACLAAIPEAASKQATWERMVSGEVPDAVLRSVLSGFCAADQDELLKPYFSKYFDVVGDVWQKWGGMQAQYFVERGYPTTVISARALDDAARYIEELNPPASLRRLLSEGRDDVARALRCRERDGQQPRAVGAGG